MTSETRDCILRRLKDPIGTIYRLFWTLDRDPRTAPLVEERLHLRNQILAMPDRDYSSFREEIDFLSTMPFDYLVTCVFPYPRIKEAQPIESGFDKRLGLPYVIHNGNTLFFTEKHTIRDAEEEYRRLTEEEGLLGTGCLAKSPHQYQTDGFHVEPADIVIDLGSAEGLFALDNVATARHTHLFECLSEWKKPMERTFAPFGDKITIHNKRVSNKTNTLSTRLEDAISMGDGDSYFLKMDIEGAERTVIQSSQSFLTRNKVKMSCCAYHRQDDAEVLTEMLKEIGYSAHYSEGFMAIPTNGVHYPYFRRGMIHARNY